MTGLLPDNYGVLQVIHTVDEDQGNLRKQHPHWAETLIDHGYQTGYFGKWYIERSNQLEDFGWQVNGAVNKPLFNAKQKLINQTAPDQNLKKQLVHRLVTI